MTTKLKYLTLLLLSFSAHATTLVQADEDSMNQDDGLVLEDAPPAPVIRPKKVAPKKLPFCDKDDFLNPYISDYKKKPMRECVIMSTPCFCMPEKRPK